MLIFNKSLSEITVLLSHRCNTRFFLKLTPPSFEIILYAGGFTVQRIKGEKIVMLVKIDYLKYIEHASMVFHCLKLN